MTTLPSVELGVLGPLQVRRDGTPVTIPGAKPRAILTMLGLHSGSVVTADSLVSLLWGDDPPRTADKALQTHISALRRVLDDGVVLTEGAGWTLAGAEVDASRYKAAARLGRAAAANGDTSQAVARFEEALTLWRGIPELPDSQRGSSEKTRWNEAHAALVEDRADALLATGRAAEIIGELEAAVADAPLRERRWGQLMLALYRAGRQGEALGAFQRARTLLADQLGVDPGPDLRRLEATIVAQDAALDMPVAQNVSTVTRAVTFLLTDIEGSTAAWEADAGAMAVALARHDELVEQVVTSRGGRLIKTRGEGDATFSVFDRPSAAAAAAIELQDAITHEPWRLRDPMRIRVALHTGEVELRDGDYFGRAVNRAARLRSLASGGQILCSGATAELVIDALADDVVLADLGTRQLRNLARPEHVFELRLQTADDRSAVSPSEAAIERPDLPAVLAGNGPFVGRGSELERLSSTWQIALAGGMRAVLIAGEPGVGKTRLAGEWSRQAYQQGAFVQYGRCDEDLGAPYQPFAEALRSLVPCLGAGRLRGLRGIEALLPLVPALTDVLPDLAAPTRADPDTERYALFDAVVALLEIASANAPVVLILDDLHWAAKPTLLLLRHLLRFGDQARVQIVGTYRSTDLDRSHPLAAMLADLHRDGTADRLQLSGLDEGDVTAYVAEAGYDDEELARALASVTGGNPFFLIEALRHVDESGGQWDPSTLPQGVREAVSRRLSRLPVETNKALAAAAVVGSRFAVDLVEKVTDQDLVDAFDEASKAGIVIEEPGGWYRFNHAIVRQSLIAELASVRRMRLHQRIATTLEAMSGADDELLAELAHHYFECAWAGNAAKAVEYCRRAADQAMARLAYEGAADLYDRALHALEELDDELPDREDLTTELLVARCEALLAAGDVASAAGAVAQLQVATHDSARLAAWATCFDGELSILVHPERLDEVEEAVGAAADKLAELQDAAGEAKAHTVRAACLARLGRIGDCEIALDNALTAARRAHEHRRVNAVLAGAPLAALWGPNPVPRAGGRCLDVIRLLRITTDSPAVEATSTRCQAVLEAYRGRAAAARRMIDSARRTVTELGLRHALLEVEHFAGIVELVIDEPAAAEPHLRRAYEGFRRMGLDADTAETAALLARTCLALDRDAEADELCSESERLAGHALRATIAWRTVRAQLLARRNEHDEARRVAEAAVTLAERTDGLVGHGDACLALATVLHAAGDTAGARAAAQRASDLYERKGAAALAENAHQLLGKPDLPSSQAQPEPKSVELDNACVQVGHRMMAAINREAWDEVDSLYASEIFVESRRKVVGFLREKLSASEVRRLTADGGTRMRFVVVAVRGERLALTRLEVGTADVSPGAPHDEFLALAGLDVDGRIALSVAFDLDDIDAAMAELDAVHARFEHEQKAPRQDNTCVQAIRRVTAAIDRDAWGDYEQMHAADVVVESHRKIVGFPQIVYSTTDWVQQVRLLRGIGAQQHRNEIVAVRGERLALTRLSIDTEDATPGAPQEEVLHLVRLDTDGRIAQYLFFDIEDVDAAMAELDAVHAQVEETQPRPPLENAASRAADLLDSLFATDRLDELGALFAVDLRADDRRRGIRREYSGRANAIAESRAMVELGVANITSSAIAVRGERLTLSHVRASGRADRAGSYDSELLRVIELDVDGQIATIVTFDIDDIDAAFEELDARYLAGEASAHAHTWSAITQAYGALSRKELPPATPDLVDIDRRRLVAIEAGGMREYLRATWDATPEVSIRIKSVHRLGDRGAVVTNSAFGTSQDGFDAEWPSIGLLTFEGDMLSRAELFDEADLDAALARFEQLSVQTRRLENAATRVLDRYQPCLAARDWTAMAELLADDVVYDDRRRVVNAGVRHGRDLQIADTQAAAEVGVESMTSSIIATRGERLTLCRVLVSGRDMPPDQFDTAVLAIIEINADNQVSMQIIFDVDEFDAAMAELDARYLAGEGATHAKTWTLIAQAFAALNRHKLGELLATTPGYRIYDHRLQSTVEAADLTALVRAMWDLTPELVMYVEAVHRLNDRGVVITQVADGISREGFDAQWRMIQLLTVEGDLGTHCELFDEKDLDAAIARFEELSRPANRLENSASRTFDRLQASFAARDWVAMAEILAEGISADDRRRVVNAGIQRGRDTAIAEMSGIAEVGVKAMTSDVIATRGERLLLSRSRSIGRNEHPDTFHVEVLDIIEVDADDRVVARVVFDPDDFDAAIAELDARYLAGEAASYSRTWSVVTHGYDAANRHEHPAFAPDWTNIDHRQARAFAPGEMSNYIDATWDVAPDAKVYIEAVHRLSDLGVVISHWGSGTSQQGFEAAWREVILLTVDGDLVSRCEMFDETDLAAALTRFDELSRSAPRLENTASRVIERFYAYFTVRDWAAMTDMLADDIYGTDRRQVVNIGLDGRDSVIESFQAAADLGLPGATSNAIATRGERLVLTCVRYSLSDQDPDAFHVDLLFVVEVDADERIATFAAYDLDDIDAALEELDARYLAGEAEPNAHTWSVITRAIVALNRQEMPATTRNWVGIDRRRLVTIEAGGMEAFLRAAWEQAPDARIHIEAVHRLSNLGAVFSQATSGTSEDGFDAEWRELALVTVEGDMVNGIELFDEADIDIAVARFEELSRPAPRLENAATRVIERVQASLTAHDWDAIAKIMADDISDDDRRRAVNAGIRRGPQAEIDNLRAIADLGATVTTSDAIATRGERLALVRIRLSTRDQEVTAFDFESLNIIEIDTDDRIAAIVTIDADNLSAAIEELDTRYLAGEAAAQANTWSLITRTYAGFNRGELPASTPDWVNADHRHVAAMAPGEAAEYFRASWELAAELNVFIESVHRLSDLGAVFTYVGKGTSRDGFEAEWRGVDIMTVDGELISGGELFDEVDIDAALARFDELSQPTRRPKNAATQVYDNFRARFAARDWDAIVEMLADDHHSDDRRRVIGAGVQHGRDAELAGIRATADLGVANLTSMTIAVRGDRLALCRVRGATGGSDAFANEVLRIVEIDADDRIATRITFDLDDIDAAFEELNARYLAGEAAAHAHTWSVIAESFAAVNRHELPELTQDWVNIDHRRAVAFAPGDMAAYIRNTLDDMPEFRVYLEAVHRLSDLGAVVTWVSSGTSRAGFQAEWREISLATVDGDLINRSEMFGETDLDAAIARFDELAAPVRHLENAASRVDARYRECYLARDWDAVTQIFAPEILIDDRRWPVNAGVVKGRDTIVESIKATADLGNTNVTSTVLATRGQRLMLTSGGYSGNDQGPEAFRTELLTVIEINGDNMLSALVVFDRGDIAAAFAELDARYLAGEAAAHGRTWSVVAEAYAAVNRHEPPEVTPDCVNVDNRRLPTLEPGKMNANLRAGWDLTPDYNIHIEAVHRLTDLGTVVTHTAHGVSQEGFDAEWRLIQLLTVDGEKVNHGEVFDETDLDAALARFDELHTQASALENAASQVNQRFWNYFATRDWDGMAELLADDISTDDRRRVVNAGIQRGRDVEIENMRALAEVEANVTVTVIATRGTRLALFRLCSSNRDLQHGEFGIELLSVVEINGDNRIVAGVVFDHDDIDAAFAELDARYLAGEAAYYSHVFSAITQATASLNRHETPLTAPETVDHRHLSVVEADDLVGSLDATWGLMPDGRIYVESVHRLADFGAVVTHVAHGTADGGLNAEWRAIDVLTVTEHLISHCEIFDEADITKALARFDELRPPAPRLENAASQVNQHFWNCFAARDWDGMAELLADDTYTDDRRRVVNAGVQRGRDVQISNMRAHAEVAANVTVTVIATRGTRLALSRLCSSNRDLLHGEFRVELLVVGEIDADHRISAGVLFDPDNIGAAFEELDARYLAGEAAAYAQTWSVTAGAITAVNSRQIPELTPDWVNVDHRRAIAFAPGEMTEYFRAILDDASDLGVYIEAVHRLTNLGTVITQASHATSHQGFDAEWRMISLTMADGDRISRCELFDESDIDAALACFDELSKPRLENAASRVGARFSAYMASPDWAAMAEMVAEDMCNDDRRPVINAGLRRGRDAEIANVRALVDLGVSNTTPVVIATRGERLVLSRIRLSGRDELPEAFQTEVLGITEIDADDRIAARVWFELDDIDAAFVELDARYLAGEAAAHARTWSVIVQAYAALNRGELSALSQNYVNIDHRLLRETIDAVTREDYVRTAREVAPDFSVYIEAVHRLSDLGAMYTDVTHGTSQAGFDAEWRMIQLDTVEGGLLNHSERFDEADVDAANARFDELHSTAPRLENAATLVWQHFVETYNRRDIASLLALVSTDGQLEDRRKGLRVLMVGPERQKAFRALFIAPDNWRLSADPIAIRGSRLCLSHDFSRDVGETDQSIIVELLTVMEICDDGTVHDTVSFDPDDIDAAFAELDARYRDGEAATHAHTWSVIAGAYATLRSRQVPATTLDSTWIDNRRGIVYEGDVAAFLNATWDIAPDITMCIESVHRLTGLGAVVTWASYGTSQKGFSAEWRGLNILTVEGDLISHGEIFDEADLDAALARFDELSAPTPRLENAATRAWQHLVETYNRRDVASLLDLVSRDGQVEDRRKGLRSIMVGPERQKAFRELVAPDSWRLSSDPLAIRGSRLCLSHECNRDMGEAGQPITVELLTVTEISDDGSVHDTVSFDPDDIDAAFAELEARYLAGEAAPHARTWSAISGAYAALNRGELLATAPDWINVDHRQIARVELGTGNLPAYLRATWDLTPELSVEIEAVHKLDDLGAVVTHTARGTSTDGVDAEWRLIELLTVDGDRISRCELFDEADLDAALARFDELSPPAP